MDKMSAIRIVARGLGDLIAESVPASVAASMVDVAALVHPVTDQLKGRDFYIYSGAGAGQDRIVTAFAPANNRLSFDQVFTTVPSTNSNFVLFDVFQKDDYDNAINRMMGLAKNNYLQHSVATIQIIATQYEYVVPTGFEYISTLRLIPTGSSDYESDDYVDRVFEFPSRYWRIESNPLGSYIIAFDPRKISLDSFDLKYVRILGQSQPVALATDNATIPAALEEYLIAGTSMLLASRRIDEKQEWRTKFYMWRDATKNIEDHIFSHRQGKKVG